MNPDIEALERLFELRERGALSEAEFDNQKSRLLAGTSSRPQRHHLRSWPLYLAIQFAAILATGFAIWLYSSRDNHSDAKSQSIPIQVHKVSQPQPKTVPPEPILDDVLTFTKPSDCRKSDALYKLFWSMVHVNRQTGVSTPGGPVKVPGFLAAITPTFDRNHETSPGSDVADVIAKLPIQGLWHGVHVKRLFLYYGEASSVIHYQIDFAEKAKQVKVALDAAGFKLGPVGKMRIIPAKAADSDIDVGMYVAKSQEGGSSLVCSTEFNYGG